MPDSRLARGLLRQETRQLAPLAQATRLAGSRFARAVATASPRPDRVDRSTFNVALASYAREVAASPATLEARHARMGLSRCGHTSRVCLQPTVVDRRRLTPDPEVEWGLGIDDLEIRAGRAEGGWWLAGATVTAHFAMRHMQRLGHEDARAALAAGARALAVALLYRDCQLLAGPDRDPWDIVAPIPGGIACGGTEAVDCPELSAQLAIGAGNRPDPAPTARSGLHLIGSLRTFLDADAIEGHQARAASDVADWVAANRAALESDETGRHSRDPASASPTRRALVASFMPVAMRVQWSFSSWRRAHQAFGRDPSHHGPAPSTGGAPRPPAWFAAVTDATGARIQGTRPAARDGRRADAQQGST